MNNYYKILDLNNNASTADIIDAYNNKIKKYSFLPFLNETQITEVKELKKAKFVLSDDKFKKIYDTMFIKENNNLSLKKEKIDSTVMSNRIFSTADILNLSLQSNYDLERSFSNNI